MRANVLTLKKPKMQKKLLCAALGIEGIEEESLRVWFGFEVTSNNGILMKLRLSNNNRLAKIVMTIKVLLRMWVAVRAAAINNGWIPYISRAISMSVVFCEWSMVLSERSMICICSCWNVCGMCLSLVGSWELIELRPVIPSGCSPRCTWVFWSIDSRIRCRWWSEMRWCWI